MTSSSSEPVSDALGSSRRAARSSSATSGLPPDRSATSRSRLADARSPSMPSMRAASSPRSRSGSASRSSGLRGGLDGCDRAGPRVVAGHDVRLIRGDERESLVGGDPGQEGDERAGRRIGAVQVLEDQDDRPPLPEPAQHPEDALERPRLSPFWCPRPLGQARSPGRIEPGRDAREDAREVGRGRAEDRVQLVVGQGLEGRPDRPDHGAVRLVGAGWHRPAAQDAHRLRERADPPDRLIEEAADPDAGRPAQEHRPSPALGRVVEDGGEPPEGAFAPHVPRARIPGRHEPS